MHLIKQLQISKLLSRHFVIWQFSIAYTLLVTRFFTYFLTKAQLQIYPSLLRGIASDILASLIIASIIILLRWNTLRALFIVIFIYLLAGNIEHIHVNHEGFNVGQIHELVEPAFLLGSGFSIPVIWKAILLLGVFLGCFIIIRSLSSLKSLFYAALIGMIGFLYPYNFETTEWQQANFLETNARIFLHYLLPSNETGMLSNKELRTIYHVDINGEPFANNPLPNNKKPNILIITTEALSPAHMEAGWTPNLEKRTEKALFYKNFVAPSRVTINGLYNILCGDIPHLNLTIPDRTQFKPAIITTESHTRACLPTLLKDNGYETIFVQSTNLNYANERKMIGLLGINKMYDDTTLPIQGESNGKWGVVDPIFHKNIKEIILAQPKDKPWFMITMSEGTHHPYSAPTECTSIRNNASPKENSFRCMDESIESLLNWLDTSEYRDNTLIFLTSDEASVYFSYPNYPSSALINNRGFMMILTPDRIQGTVEDTFSQSDIFVSIADYIHMDTPEHDYGRSLFRTYKEPRTIYGGATYQGIAWMLTSQNQLLLCSEATPCKKYSLNPQTLFSGPYVPVPVNSEQNAFFKRAINSINAHLPREVPH